MTAVKRESSVALAALAAGSDALIRSAGAVSRRGVDRRSASPSFMWRQRIWEWRLQGSGEKGAARMRVLVPSPSPERGGSASAASQGGVRQRRVQIEAHATTFDIMTPTRLRFAQSTSPFQG